MLLVKILGALDLLGGVLFISLNYGLGEEIALVVAIAIIIKSLVFIKAFASYMDLIVGIILLAGALGYYYGFIWLFSIWLFQKAFFSFFS